MGFHENGAEGQSHLSCPAAHTAFDAAQVTSGSLGCQCTSLAPVELLDQDPQVIFPRADLNPFSSQAVLVLGISQQKKKVQNLVLGLVGFYEVCFSQARLCSLSRSLCMPSLPSSKSMAPRSSVSLANLLKLLSNSLSPLLTKMLNSDGP